MIDGIQGLPLGLRLTASFVLCWFASDCVAQMAATAPDDAQLNKPYVASCAAGADLYDLWIITEDRLCAIGARGLILSSDNGGRQWNQIASPTTAALHGIAFISSEQGIIVGGAIGSYTGSSRGVILRTIDGGRSWTTAPSSGLPRLLGVHLQQGRLVAWGDYSPLWQTSVFESLDGGLSWQGSGLPIGHASAAGVFGGHIAAIDSLGRGRMPQAEALQALTTPQRPWHRLHHTGSNWLACGARGELTTSIDGRAWSDVPVPLTTTTRQTCTWRSLAQVDDQIWVGGSPGSILLHSPDRGRTWTVRKTGQTLPIHAIRFFDSGRGWMVGPLGSIWATRDGGNSWYPQRQPVQRLGLLSLSADAEQVPWPCLVAAAWEEQMATVSMVCDGGEPIEQADFLPSMHQRWTALAPQVGIAQHSELSQLSSGEHAAAIELLAVQLLTWRPDVILTSAPSKPNPFRAFADLAAIVPAAIELAEKAATSPAAQDLSLPAWSVQKWVQVTDERSAQYSEQPLRILRTPGLSIRDLLLPLPPEVQLTTNTVALRTAWARSQAPAAQTSLLGGLAPSKENRWDLPIQDIGNYQLVMGRIHRDRTLLRLGDFDGRIAADSQWRQGFDLVLKGLPANEIAPAVYRLASWLVQPRDWPRKRYALERLIEMQSSSDAADWARLELIKLMASDEYRAWAIWQASQNGATAPAVALASAGVPPSDSIAASQVAAGSGVVPTAESVWSASPFDSMATAEFGAGNHGTPEAAPVIGASAERLESSPYDTWLSGDRQIWFASLENALRQSLSLRSRPDLSLLTYRQRQLANQIDVEPTLDRSVHAEPLIGWPQVARQELLLERNQLVGPRWIAMAAFAEEPPQLDGQLDESFWGSASAMQLTSIAGLSEGSSGTTPASIRWGYDAEYLYVGIQCPRSSVTEISPLHRVRTYDSQLDDVDRVELLLDCDRDYNTAIELGVAEDGRTFDRLAGIAQYNPKWHVYVKPEATQWTAEVAIEMRGLTTQDQLAGGAWGVSARRHDPSTGQSQSWSQLKTHRGLLQGNGLLLFVPPNNSALSLSKD